MAMVSDNQSGNLKTMTVCKNIVKNKLKIRITSRNVEAEPRIESSEFRHQMFINDGSSCDVSEVGSKKSVMNKSHKFVLHYPDDSKVHTSDTLKVKLPMRPSNKRGPPGMVDGHKEKRQKMERSVKQQCSSILKTLMTHPAGWVFNKPVDPMALNIPDYFSIISKPMDLGTIKTKLDEYVYFTVEEFAADVRLTFSNAMLYNPPSNNVHLMAKELENIFTSRWKSLQGKVICESRNAEQGCIIMGRAKKSQDTKEVARKKSPMHVSSLPKISLVSEEKRKLKKELIQASSGKMTEKLQSFLQKFGLINVKEEKLDMNIDALDGETLWELKSLIKDSLDARDGKAVTLKMAENGRRQFSGKVVHKVSGNRSACGFADTKPSLSSVTPRCGGSCGNATCQCSLRNDHAYASSSERSVGQGQCASKMDCEEKNKATCHVNKSESDGAISSLDEEINCSTSQCTMPVTTAASGEGSSSAIDVQLSPKKALRAAMLKSRFADTIFKAKQMTLLDNGDKVDPVRMQQEKERLERQQQEEKARIEAQIRAAEAASRLKAEEELKTQREREREAARISLQKMEKTAEIDDNLEILKDLEMLRGSVFEAIEAGRIGNPLERLGLFIKDDYLGGDDDDEIAILNGYGEEGEIFS